MDPAKEKRKKNPLFKLAVFTSFKLTISFHSLRKKEEGGIGKNER